MSSVDLFLEDEGQQYGNMEEAASVARTPATCLEVWSGDHRQIWTRARKLMTMKIEVGMASPDIPAPYMSVPITVAAPKRPSCQVDP